MKDLLVFIWCKLPCCWCYDHIGTTGAYTTMYIWVFERKWEICTLRGAR